MVVISLMGKGVDLALSCQHFVVGVFFLALLNCDLVECGQSRALFLFLVGLE